MAALASQSRPARSYRRRGSRIDEGGTRLSLFAPSEAEPRQPEEARPPLARAAHPSRSSSLPRATTEPTKEKTLGASTPLGGPTERRRVAPSTGEGGATTLARTPPRLVGDVYFLQVQSRTAADREVGLWARASAGSPKYVNLLAVVDQPLIGRQTLHAAMRAFEDAEIDRVELGDALTRL